MLRDVKLSVVMLSVFYAECCYAESRGSITFFTSKTQHQFVRVNSTLK
jgi:hypothetical protein